MTYRTHQRRLLPHLADAYALHFAQERLVATLAERFGEEGERGRELETMAAGLKARRHLARDGDDPGLPRGVRRPGLPARQPLRRAEGRHRRLHHLRGRQHRAAAARGQEPADRLQARLPRSSTCSARPSFFAGQLFALIAERSALRELIGPDRRRPDPRPRRGGRPARARGPARRGALARGARAGRASPAACAAASTTSTDPFELLIACQDHLVLAARAYVDRLVLEAFADAVERAPEGERELLGAALRPARPAPVRARARLVPGARPLLLDALEGGHPRGQRGLRGPRPARPAPGRRVRDPGDAAWPSAATIAGGA